MKKKKKNYLLIVIIILFSIYCAIQFSYTNGYYQTRAYKKMTLTEEAMKRFERDIEEGKNISINEYIINDFKDYSNGITNVGVKTGEIAEDLVTKGMGRFFKVLGKLFTN